MSKKIKKPLFPFFVIIIKLIFLFFVTNNGYSQTFEKIYKTEFDDYSNDALRLTDDSFIILINSGTFYEDEYNAKIVELSSSGDFIDSLLLPIPDGFVCKGFIKLLQLDISTFFTFGICKSYQTNETNIYIVEFDSSLIIKNQNISMFIMPEQYNVSDIIFNNNDFITIGTDLNDYNYFLINFNSSGELITSKIYNNIANNPTYASSIINLYDINKYHLYIFGYPQNFLIIDKETLEIETILNYTNTFLPFGNHKAITDSSYYVTGRNYIGNSIKVPAFMEVDFEGTVLNTNYYIANPDTNSGNRGETFDFYYTNRLYFGSAYNFVINESYPFIQTKQWIWLNCINENYSIKWQHFYKGDVNYMPTKVLATTDGGALILSTKYDWNDPIPYQRDLHILKVDSTGWYEGMTTGETEYDQPKQILVYPNPVKDKLNFVTGFYNNLNLEIYDLQGNKVLSKHLPYTQTIDMTNLPEGMYIYIITDGKGFIEKGKLVKD